MITAQIIRRTDPDFREIRRLYNSSFPDDERMPFRMVISHKDSRRKAYAFRDDGVLVGLAYLFTHENLSYLGYLAVEEHLRSQGYGTKLIRKIHELYPDSRIVIDIEEVKEDAEDYELRRRRKDFYLRCGFQETGVFYNIWHVDYELLSLNGIVTREDYDALIKEQWGVFALKAVYK